MNAMRNSKCESRNSSTSVERLTTAIPHFETRIPHFAFRLPGSAFRSRRFAPARAILMHPLPVPGVTMSLGTDLDHAGRYDLW